MTLTRPKPISTSSIFNATDETRWQCVVRRDPASDGTFVYSVRTTGVYCRPVCAARLALRENVRFHDTGEDARRAGFRACKRCRPDDVSVTETRSAAITRACRLIEKADEIPALAELAESVGISPSHFHRLFKTQTGVTPRQYASNRRSQKVREQLGTTRTITEAIHGAGFGSASRFYEHSTETLGMRPAQFREGASGLEIRFAVRECHLGRVLMAASDTGVCAILLGDDPVELIRELRGQFSNARLTGDDPEFATMLGQVIAFVDDPAIGFNLPLDIRGSVFQQRVWAALREIPPGATATYAEIAGRIGNPKAIRAVAGACAANRLAMVIPCHRVVRTDDTPSGYRWGIERKKQLLRLEQETD